MNLSELRKEIDLLDERILAMIGQRIQAARHIAEIKRKDSLPIYDADREEKILLRLSKLAEKSKIERSFIETLYKAILDYSKKEMGCT